MNSTCLRTTSSLALLDQRMQKRSWTAVLMKRILHKPNRSNQTSVAHSSAFVWSGALLTSENRQKEPSKIEKRLQGWSFPPATHRSIVKLEQQVPCQVETLQIQFGLFLMCVWKVESLSLNDLLYMKGMTGSLDLSFEECHSQVCVMRYRGYSQGFLSTFYFSMLFCSSHHLFSLPVIVVTWCCVVGVT